MPQLKSGRRVALSASPILNNITQGTDDSKLAAIMVFRLDANSPERLRDYLAVGYFREGTGEPPNAESYHSGFTVGDVLAGRADWTEEEVEEFRTWIDTAPHIMGWLQAQYDEIDAAIRDSPVLSSSLSDED